MVDANYLMQGLVQRGLPPHVAQGFVMNMRDESGLNPGINEVAPTVPGSRGGFGLYQLTGPRRRAYEAFAQERGVNVADPDAQLDFLMTELQGPESRAAQSIFATENPQDAAVAIARDFLRPAPENLQKRVAQYTGGTNMARQPQPVSGTPTMSTQGRAAPQAEEEKVPFFQRPGVGNALDSLAIALQGMTINPNQALMQLSANRIQGRRKAQQTKAQQNRTADWLESQGMTAAAQGVRSGAIGARDALAMARGGEATAAQRNFEFLVSQGLPPGQAMERAFGGGVTVNTGDQRPQVGTIPQGYQMVQDPETGAYRMEPIPGGPAEAEAESAAEAAAKRGSQATRAAGVVLEDIDALQETLRKSKLPITGAIGSLVRNIPGTDAYDASAMIQTIAGNIGFDRLQQMREASPTGGALGAVSERELSTLQSVLGSLDQAQSQAQFERNLNRLEDIYTEIMRKASAYPNANDFGFGGQGGATQQGGGATLTGQATHRFNPETGQVEEIQP